MRKLRITGVPEHYSFPAIEALKSIHKNFPNTWEYSSGGTGEMIEKLENDKIDVAILLTDGFIKSQEKLKPIFIDFYVSSPLHWGIHTYFESPLENDQNIEGLPALISRLNSGSHLMLKVLGDREGWTKEPKLEIIRNLDGALDYCAKTKSDFIFLWEKFTTAAHCQPGKFKSIGVIPTPWPAFSIALNPKALENWDLAFLRDFFSSLKFTVQELLQKQDFQQRISEFAELPLSEIQQWLKFTSWYQIKDPSIELREAQEKLLELGIVNRRHKIDFLFPH